MIEFFNRHDQKDKRQALRREAPPAQEVLWMRLRRRAVGGARFRHQYSVGPFVADFSCPAHKLALEIDGPTYNVADGRDYDAGRQQLIETAGISFLRFTTARIYNDLDAVVAEIAGVVPEPPPSLPFTKGLPARECLGDEPQRAGRGD